MITRNATSGLNLNRKFSIIHTFITLSLYLKYIVCISISICSSYMWTWFFCVFHALNGHLILFKIHFFPDFLFWFIFILALKIFFLICANFVGSKIWLLLAGTASTNVIANIIQLAWSANVASHFIMIDHGLVQLQEMQMSVWVC